MAAGLAIAGLLVACTAEQGSSSALATNPRLSALPTPSASPDETGSSSESAAAEPAHEALAIDEIAVTAADGIRVREEPSAAAEQLSALDAGTRVFLLEGPVADRTDSALEWWRVAPYACDGCPGYDPRIGWISSGPEGEWLDSVTLECRDSYTAADAERFPSPEEMLACHGSNSITLEGIVDYWCCSELSIAVTEPSWLAGTPGSMFAMLRQDVAGESGGWGPHLRVDPSSGVELGDRGTVARIIGHYDDPAARTCVATVSDDDRALNPNVVESITAEGTVHRCRLQFVVEDVEVLDFVPLPTHAPQG